MTDFPVSDRGAPLGPTYAAQPGGADAPAEAQRLKEMQSADDYWSNPEKQRQVAEGYRRLYSGQIGPGANLKKGPVGPSTSTAATSTGAPPAAVAGRPTDPSGYSVDGTAADLPPGVVLLTEKPGADFKPEDGKQYFLVDNSDPLMAFWREQAHAAGLDNAGFMKGVAAFASAELKRRGASNADLARWQSQQLQALGRNAGERINRVRAGVRALAGEKTAKALDIDYLPADAIAGLEHLVQLAQRS